MTSFPIEQVRADFPILQEKVRNKPLVYFDSAASSQKPQAVIDAISHVYAHDYANIHRGVHTLSVRATDKFEAAREKVRAFINANSTKEIIFVRGATEAINLVAYSYPRKGRVLLSTLEHHSNIVPWQLAGWQVDVCPLTADGRIDLDAAEAMLTAEHTMVAFAHVSNVLGSMLDAERAVALAHRVGAKILLDGCQAVARLPVDVAALGCDFYAFSSHKLYGPTGIGALWGRAELLDRMAPWQGGGAMIERVTFEGSTFAPAPQRFEAGTPAIIEAIGFGAAADYVRAIGLQAIHDHEAALVAELRAALRARNDITLFGPEESAGIVSFAMDGVHPHDLGTILDEEGVAIRAGHHCAQPLMDHLGVPATARASFGLYSDSEDIAALLRGIERTRRIFG